MAFRTVVGQDYQAKNRLDDFIERQENKARVGNRIESSLFYNAGQAAVIASDVLTRGVHKGWVLAQKTAWNMKQSQIESNLASSGMQKGMKTVGPAKTIQTSKIVKEPLQPINLQIARQVGSLVTIAWTTKLSAGNPAARADSLLSITQAQVMIDGKFRPQGIHLGLHENGERKLEITVDVGEPGLHAVQIRNFDAEKWSQWSDSLSVDVNPSTFQRSLSGPQGTQTAKMLKKKGTIKAETGIFSRTQSAGGVPAFLAQLPFYSSTSNVVSDTNEHKLEADAVEEGVEGAKAGKRPEKEDDCADEDKGNSATRSGSTKKDGSKPQIGMFHRSTSAPAAPAFLLRRMPSAAPAAVPPGLEEALQDQSPLDGSAHKNDARVGPSGVDLTESSLTAGNQMPRIAPSRAKSMVGGAGIGGGVSAPSEKEADNLGKEDASGFGRTGSAVRAAAAGISRFRRAASKVSNVLRVSSAGKAHQKREGEDGGSGGAVTATNDNIAGAGGEDNNEPHTSKPDNGGIPPIFGFKRSLSAPNANSGNEVVGKNSWQTAFARLRSLPRTDEKDSAPAIDAEGRGQSPVDEFTSIFIEVRLPMVLSTIDKKKEQQIKLSVAAMAGLDGEALVVEGMESAAAGSKMSLQMKILTTRIEKVRLRINLDRLNLELKRCNLPAAKGIKEEKNRNHGRQPRLLKRHTMAAGPVGSMTVIDFSHFKKMMSDGSEDLPAKMELAMDITASKVEVLLLYDSVQEGLLEAGKLERYANTSVNFLSQKEVKGTRLQKTKVMVKWNISAPAGARDDIFAALTDSDTGLRKWAERKGLPEVTVNDLTIIERSKPVSRLKRAATKVAIINSFASAAKAKENDPEFERSNSAPPIGQSRENAADEGIGVGHEGSVHGLVGSVQQFERTPSGGVPKVAVGGFAIGGFTRTPSAPDYLSSNGTSKGVIRSDSLANNASTAVQPIDTSEPICSNSQEITTEINPHNVAITRTSSGGVYAHATSSQTSTSGIFASFFRAQSAEVKSEIAYDSEEGVFSRVTSAGDIISRASAAVGNIFQRDANDTFSRAASRGQEDRFSRAGSAASQQSDRFMKHVNAEGYGTIFQKREADEERGNLFERAIEGMKPDIYGGEVSGLPDSAQRHKNSAHCPEDEGPRTPVMHIEPRRLCLKKAYQRPTIARPKSEHNPSEEFGRAPSLTTLAASKPKTAPKEDSLSAIQVRRERKSRRRNGYAAHTWSSGEKYEGEWVDGVMHGKGSYYYADDYEDENRQRANDHMHRYVGEFMNGKFNGKGLKHLSNGDTYEGDFKDGKFHGKGVFFSKETGDTYSGGFWKGRFHGRGVQVASDGHRQSVLYDAKRL